MLNLTHSLSHHCRSIFCKRRRRRRRRRKHQQLYIDFSMLLFLFLSLSCLNSYAFLNCEFKRRYHGNFSIYITLTFKMDKLIKGQLRFVKKLASKNGTEGVLHFFSFSFFKTKEK